MFLNNQFSADLAAAERWWSAIITTHPTSGAPLAIVADHRRHDDLVMPFSRVVPVNTAETNLSLVRRIRELAKNPISAAEAVPSSPQSPSAESTHEASSASTRKRLSETGSTGRSAVSATAAGAGSAGDGAGRTRTTSTSVMDLVDPDPERSEEIIALVTDLAKRVAASANTALSHVDRNRRAEWLELGVDPDACDIMQTNAENLPPRPGTAGVTEIERRGKLVQWLV